MQSFCVLAGQASLMDEQVEGALCRIFDYMGEDAYEVARQFYCRLIDLKFCKVKDCAFRIFIQYLLMRLVSLHDLIFLFCSLYRCFGNSILNGDGWLQKSISNLRMQYQLCYLFFQCSSFVLSSLTESLSFVFVF